MVITQIIHGQNDRFFIRWQHQIRVWCKSYVAIFILCLNYQITQSYKYISIVIHLLGNAVKFFHGCHPRVHAVHCIFSQYGYVKCTIRIIDQGMIENVWHCIDIHRNTCCLLFFKLFDQFCDLRIFFIIFYGL